MDATILFRLSFTRFVLIVFTTLSFFSSINYDSLERTSSSSSSALKLSGPFHEVATDYGNQHYCLPSAVLHPDSVQTIRETVERVYQLGPHSGLTITARGNGHSTGGQSLACDDGMVVKMGGLRGNMNVTRRGDLSFIDVYGGELWINVLHESLKHGLTPVSWTDYLYLTVGGTLSNAGISGQTFKHGPQISNVYELEVVTGKGQVVICSEKQNDDLFFSVLGGLGQFGIITRARIVLAPAPKKVKWIRVVYLDFLDFVKDQEYLVTSKNKFDYVEGFVKINKTGRLNNWWPSFIAKDASASSLFNTDERILYCLEVAKYYDPHEIDTINEEVESLLSELDFIKFLMFSKDVSYVEFLDRVHTSEMALRAQDLWDVPHPWLNVFVPGSKIFEFARGIFGNILKDSKIDIILIYPVCKSKWNNRTSVVIPDDDIFYPIGFLSTVLPGTNTLDHILNLNKKIIDFCESMGIGMMQYLPHYPSQKEWQEHFGSQWKSFVKKKYSYDPFAILAPNQRIFNRKYPISWLPSEM